MKKIGSNFGGEPSGHIICKDHNTTGDGIIAALAALSAVIDINQPFSVIGVGDMSGDVFGNGMLLSNQIKLIAAFNHESIFIDPNPDTKTTFQERKRLFKLSRSTWNDFNEKLLSQNVYIEFFNLLTDLCSGKYPLFEIALLT